MLFHCPIRIPKTSVFVLLLTTVVILLSGTTVLSQGEEGSIAQYVVHGVTNKFQRTEIAGTGAAIDAVGDDWVEISAIQEEVSAIRSMGYQVELIPQPVHIEDFPPEDSDYHDYAEMVAEINQSLADHPNIVDRFSIGQSYEGRDLWAVKISDNPTLDESEPEVFFDVHQHAREHLTVEQGLYILQILTDEYNTTPQITGLVNSREIYILFDVNPDGGEYDHLGGIYHNWRKNRQPNEGSTAIGTDLNRNWSYQWGCCDGSSDNPGSITYRGPYPFSAPETDAIRSFVESRVISGKQQISVHIDFHTYGELILWPYGYTYEDVPPDMTVDDHDVFVAMGQNMASLNGYRAMQGSDSYITDGNIKDWMYGVHRIFSYVFELYPRRSSQGGHYPGDEIIPTETARNRKSLLYLLELADCPYRAIGKESEYCPNNPPDEPSSPSPADGASSQSVDVDLSWTGGDPDGDSVIYDVYLRAFDTPTQTLVSEGQSAASLDPGTLRCSADYYWVISARDVHWATTSGDVWQFTTEVCPPMGAPSNLTTTAASGTQINLTWWDNSSAESAFRVERSPEGSTDWTEIGSVGAGVENYQDSGLSCSTRYHYRVRGYRSSDGQYTDYSNMAHAATHPCAPMDLGVTATSLTQIDLAWQDNSSDESAFHIERSPDGSTDWTEITSVGANAESYQDSTLSCGTHHHYRVRAYRSGDGQYSGYSNVIGAMTDSCPPTDLAATATSLTQIDLNWQDNSSDESDFRVERSPDGSTDWTEIASVGADVTSYQDSGLSCSTSFYYRVCAHRDGDNHYSEYSSVVNGITYTCAPTGLEATASQNTQIDLTWQDNSSDESAFHIERSPDGNTNWAEIATVGADVTGYQDSTLSCNTDYYYRVRTYRLSDGYYSDYAEVANASTQSCPLYLPLLLKNY
jgi:carboxypeptidase T